MKRPQDDEGLPGGMPDDFTVADIRDAAITSGAEAENARGELEDLLTHEQGSDAVINLRATQLLIHECGKQVLSRLMEHGVEDAEVIVNRLLKIDHDAIEIDADLFGVARDFDEEEKNAESGDERVRAGNLAWLSRAAAAVAVVAARTRLNEELGKEPDRQLVVTAEEMIDDAELAKAIEGSTAEALHEVLEEFRGDVNES